MTNKIKLTTTDILVVIDVQKDFCSGGALAVQNADAVVTPINNLMEIFNNVVLSQDWHPVGHKSFYTSHENKKPFENSSYKRSWLPRLLSALLSYSNELREHFIMDKIKTRRGPILNLLKGPILFLRLPIPV